MALYQIENTQTSVIFGEYEGANEAAALDTFARDAGYRNYAAACNVALAEDSEIIATLDGKILVTLVS